MSSSFIKDCLADALFLLLREQRIEDIRVPQICERAGYHRASWFRSFHSKSEAVTYKMVRFWDEWCDAHDVVIRDGFSLDNADTFFQYNYDIRDTLRLLYRRGLMNEVQASFVAILQEQHHDDDVLSYENAVYAYALYGILREWIVRDFSQTPEEMAIIIRRTFSHT